MLKPHIHESFVQKKQSQGDFFGRYEKFTLLIQSIHNILSGSSSRSLEGNEIGQSINLLDLMTRDLQRIGSRKGQSPLEQEEYGQEILRRWIKRDTSNHGKNTPKWSDVYGALSEILALDRNIADHGIIPLDTSIFQSRKRENSIAPKGLLGSIERVETVEKYALFCEVFQNTIFPEGKKLSLQDCMIYEEQLEGEGRMREIPYKIIYIPAPITQTWCISDEIGQAIYIYEGHPLLDTIISDMKGGNGQHNSQSLIWKRESDKMKRDIDHILQNGIQPSSTSPGVPTSPSIDRANIPTEDMKLRLWAQKSLMEAQEYLYSIGMKYLGNGKWNLREMKENGTWKNNIGGKRLPNFPSGKWNKTHKSGNEKGALQNPTHIVDMLVSIGYRREDILEKILDPLKWDIGMRGNEEIYKRTARTELEKEEHKNVLDSIGMVFLGNGKWNLQEIKGYMSWKNNIGGKNLSSFPSSGWNKSREIGSENGKLQNSTHVALMLVSIGYKRENILEKIPDLLEWNKEIDEETYKKTARTELEKEEHKTFLDSIGMKYLGNGKWNLQEIKGYMSWKNNIGGKNLSSFPSSGWNKSREIGSNSGMLHNPTHVALMLVSIGYKRENILEKIPDLLEWNKEIDEETYKKTARTELEKEEHKTFLDSIGMKYLGNGKWNLCEMKGAGTWKYDIGEKKLMSFPSGTWNKRQALGSENGIIQNPTHIVDMLVSIGYRREDILEKILDPLKWDIGMRGNEEIYKRTARTELEKEEHKNVLDSIGMVFLGNGKWNLREIKGNGRWKKSIGGRTLKNFPSGLWNKVNRIGITSGVLQNPTHIVDMLVSIGYKRENIIGKAT